MQNAIKQLETAHKQEEVWRSLGNNLQFQNYRGANTLQQNIAGADSLWIPNE